MPDRSAAGLTEGIRMSISKRIVGAAAVAVGGVLLSFVAVIPAQAAEGSGSCSSNDSNTGLGDLCLYYNSGYAGARFNDPWVDNYAGWTFKSWSGGKTGAGESVKNNAASVQNWDLFDYGCLYYNSNQSGPVLKVAAGTEMNLSGTSLYNENASQAWSC